MDIPLLGVWGTGLLVGPSPSDPSCGEAPRGPREGDDFGNAEMCDGRERGAGSG